MCQKRLEDITIIRSNRGRLPKNEKNGFVRNQNDGKNLRTARILFGFGKTVRADKNDPLQNYGLNPPLNTLPAPAYIIFTHLLDTLHE